MTEFVFDDGRAMALISRAVTGADASGNDEYSTTGAVLVYGAFAPTSSNENTVAQDQVSEAPIVYIPPGHVPAPTDWVMLDPDLVTAGGMPQLILDVDGNPVGGVLYEIDGRPGDWRSPFEDWNPGVEIRLKRVTG